MPWPLALQALHLLTITGMFYTHTHTRTFMLFKVPIVTDFLLKGHFDHFDRFGHFDTYNLKLITFLSFFLDLLVILPRRHSFKGWNWISLDVPRSFELVWMLHSWMFEIQSNPANPANPANLTRQTSVSAFCCRRLARQWGRSALGTSTCYLTLDKAPDTGTRGFIWSTLHPLSQTVTDCHRPSHKLSVFLMLGQDCKNMLAVNYWNATIGVFG